MTRNIGISQQDQTDEEQLLNTPTETGFSPVLTMSSDPGGLGLITNSLTSPSRIEHSFTSSELPPPGYYQTVTQILSFMQSLSQQMQDMRRTISSVQDIRRIVSNIDDRLLSLEKKGSAIEEVRVSHFNVEIDNLLASLQPLRIMIPEPEMVQAYLVNYPDMAELLPLVCQIARDQVGDDTQLSLGIYTDPEGGKGHLSLYIRPKYYTDTLFETISNIEAQYIDQLIGKTGWIVVTTDFQNAK